MPVLDETPPEDVLIKLMLIGDGKIGKTYYAGMAAAAGFKVLYFDGDVAIQTLQMLPAEAKKNLYYLKVGDHIDGGLDHAYADFFVEFTGNSKVVWNDSRQRMFSRRLDENHNDEIWEILPGKMDHSVVWVIEWTSLVQSCMHWAASNAGVDLADTDTPAMRPVYQAAGNKLTQFLYMIQRCKCHVIAIMHPDEFIKTESPVGVKVGQVKESEKKILWTKMIPKSSSKPHSLTLAKYFTDVAWAEMNPAGTERRLNFKLTHERISGGHFNDVKSMDEFSFANLVKHLNGYVPDGSETTDSWLTRHPAGTYVPAGAVAAKPLSSGTDSKGGTKPVLLKAQDKVEQAPVAIKGLAGLMAKSK